MKERLISELQVGEVRSGHVISLADFGAFVDIGGADGLIHISELSWKRISHPSEVVKVGQEVQVKVLGVDPERKRISLSLRELEADPWDNIIGEYKEGQLVEGTITKLTKFGAFAYLKGTEEYEIEGLIHISELSDRRIEHPKEVVEEGQTLTLRMINIDQQRRRIGLSLKQVDSSDFSDLDWQTAMQEREEGSEAGELEQAVDELVDFDAALEEELAATGPIDELETGEDESSEEVLEESALEIDEEPVSEVVEDVMETEQELAAADSKDESSEEVLEEPALEVDEEPVSEVVEDAIETEQEPASAEVETNAEEIAQTEIEIDVGETAEDTDEVAEDDQPESDALEEPVVEESDTDEKS
jgi:ribosomal protein S1